METLAVEVMAVRFSGDDFAVLAAVTDDGEEVTLTGPLAHVHEGEALDVGGSWRTHPKHGRQFHVEHVRARGPVSEAAVRAYLQTIKHVGPRGADFLLDRFGGQVLDEIDRDPAGVLGEVPGIGRRRLRDAVGSWERQGATRAVRLFLEEHGVPAAPAARLVRVFGPEAIERLRSDPYAATSEAGIGFATADALARALGVPPDAPGRLDAGLLHALALAEDDGHCHLPRGELEARAARLLGADASDRIDELAASGRLSLDGDARVSDPVVDGIERRLARRVRALVDAEPTFSIPDAERPDGITDGQWAGVRQALDHRLSILTGGPGVGKCVRGDTLVLVNGDWLPIEEVWQRFARASEPGDGGEWSVPSSRLLVPSIDADGRMRLARVTRLFRQHVREPGRRVLLADGSEAVMTRRHRVLGVDGWTADVSPGDLVCVPGTIPSRPAKVDKDLAELLAWQIAEGYESCGRQTTVQITQKDVRVLERLRDTARRVERTHGVPMHSMPIREQEGRSATLTIGSAPYRRLLEKQGYTWGSLSRDKRIPGFMMRADNAAVATFLRAIFAAEGSIAADSGRVEISSASRILVWQLAVLLRRWGIWMRIRTVRKCATNGSRIVRDYFQGSISGPSLRHFAFTVGFAHPRKEARLFDVAIRGQNANLETVAVNDLLVEAKTLTGLSRHFFGLQGRGGHRYKAHNRTAFGVLDRDAMTDLCTRFEERLERDVRYVRVARVEEVPLDGWVYDLEVEDHHNYVAGGMITHNTTSMRALVDLVRGAKRTVRLCAPTGKAARRLAESAGHEATTIHRLLEWSPEDGGFQRDESDPIPGCDLLIVDEASMLSLRLADALFQAVGPRTHVLLVGDADQLPPVGAGRVLDDLVESGAVPAVRLTEIFRQAQRSLIVRAAHAINHGEPPPTRPASDDDLRDFFLVSRLTPQHIFDEVVSLASARLPAHYDLDPVADVQVLAPMHRGVVGIEALNTELRARLNSDGEPIPGTPFRVGDKIVETVNNHERELMNGQTGVLVLHDSDRDRVLLATDDGRRIMLPIDETRTLRLAYALSIHKSQGGQWPAVVVALDRGHHVMLTRNLLYTAVTRSAQVCVLAAHPAAIETALRIRDGGRRHTRLAELVAP